MPRETIDLAYQVPYLGILDADGHLDEDLLPDLDDDLLRRLHEHMLLARRFDERRLRLQRQGSIGTFAPVQGQDAANLVPISAIGGRDWFVPSFREPAAMHWRGAPLEQILLYDAGFNEGAAAWAKARERVAELQERREALFEHQYAAMQPYLVRQPRFNASIDEAGEKVRLREAVHIGIAVATEEGLLVPVLRDADRQNLLEVARELRRFADRAARRELRPAGMKDGSLTITNIGAIGGRSFTPIIKPPEVAILGVGAAFAELVPSSAADGPGFATVTRLPLSFAFDHRVNDGADAARFVNHLKRLLADPAALCLEI